MPNKHKNPTLCWHPPAELSAWARSEAELRGVHLKVILDEALVAYRAVVDTYRAMIDGEGAGI